MKLKIVIKMQMHCDKCRNKALKTAAQVKGVTSVSLEGDDKDSVVVIGDNVDTRCLANQLQKKFSNVTIVSVEKVKSAAEKKEEEEKKKAEEKKKKEAELKKCRALLCDTGCSCHGKCDDKCSKCDAKCTCSNPTTCTKCESPNCRGQCKPACCKCQNSKCDGQCKPACYKCQNSKCDGQCKPPSPCFRSCPPWCTCPKCYGPYPGPIYNPCYPPNFTVAYDPNPNSCSIM